MVDTLGGEDLAVRSRGGSGEGDVQERSEFHGGAWVSVLPLAVFILGTTGLVIAGNTDPGVQYEEREYCVCETPPQGAIPVSVLLGICLVLCMKRSARSS